MAQEIEQEIEQGIAPVIVAAPVIAAVRVIVQVQGRATGPAAVIVLEPATAPRAVVTGPRAAEIVPRPQTEPAAALPPTVGEAAIAAAP